MLEEGTFK
jgi:hypothetical protein